MTAAWRRVSALPPDALGTLLDATVHRVARETAVFAPPTTRNRIACSLDVLQTEGHRIPSHFMGDLVHERFQTECLLRVPDTPRRSGVGDIGVDPELLRLQVGDVVDVGRLRSQAPETDVVGALVHDISHVQRMERHVLLHADASVHLGFESGIGIQDLFFP